jgi:hypothetical protein
VSLKQTPSAVYPPTTGMFDAAEPAALFDVLWGF